MYSDEEIYQNVLDAPRASPPMGRRDVPFPPPRQLHTGERVYTNYDDVPKSPQSPGSLEPPPFHAPPRPVAAAQPYFQAPPIQTPLPPLSTPRQPPQPAINQIYQSVTPSVFNQTYQPPPPLCGAVNLPSPGSNSPLYAFTSSIARELYSNNVANQIYSISSNMAVKRLEDGVVVTVYSLKRRPEKMHLMVQSGVQYLLCISALGKKPEIKVDLNRVHEVRQGRRCMDFEKYPEEANREDSSLCIAIFYGTESVPRSLAVAAKNAEDFVLVVTALRTVVETTHNSQYQIQRQRWFRRQFEDILGTYPGMVVSEKVSIKQLRGWLLKNSLKVSKKVIHPIQQQLCLSNSFKYGGFMAIVTEIMRIPLIKKRLQKYFVLKEGVQCVTPATFMSFLKTEQLEAGATEASAKETLNQYWEGDSSRQASSSNKLNMILTEFEDFLFSPFNSIWNPAFNTVYQDMTRPLSEYWISTSHNTYLVGHQLTGQSSEEMYASCLRRGCRCLELDCWDGSDGQPMITHGRTLTTKIKASEVLKVIKENAWLTSEYPIILSIENHLSLPQQRFFAQLLKDVFKDDLLTEPIDPNETQMPSPEQLKGKILIKDKKLRTDRDQDADDLAGGGFTGKAETLFMRFQDETGWSSYSLCVTSTSVFFSRERNKEEEEEEEDDAVEDVDYEEYFDEYDSDEEEEDDLKYQPWYYANLPKTEIRKLLKPKPVGTGSKQPLQDGSFLLRDSQGVPETAYESKYVLSFIWEGDMKHVRVKTKEENGRTLYTFGNEVWYPTITELVKYFRSHRLYIVDAEKQVYLYLDKPVCKPHEHIDAAWYQPKMNRFAAEKLLLRIPQEGAFLIRGSSEPGCLSLSFRHKKKISHFQVSKRGRAYVCGPYRFLSLPKMIDFFHRRPLYRKTKLTVAASESIAEPDEDEDCAIYDSMTYCDPSDITCVKKVSVRALYDFMAQDADQLSFTRSAVITNVREEDKPWWKGDYGDLKQKYFPSNYVQIIPDKEEERRPPEGDTIRGREDTLELKACRIAESGPLYLDSESGMFYFTLQHPRYETRIDVGSRSQLQLSGVRDAIKEGQSRMGEKNIERQRQEKTQKRAQELSDLVVYCQSVPYDPYSETRRYYHVSSLGEDKVNLSDENILKASRQQLLRVYPKGSRIKSTNFDPTDMWVLGIQMVALNYQTPDVPMQINQARFLSNGGCGYVLKPKFLNERCTLKDIIELKLPSNNLILTVTVLAGRNLCAGERDMGVVRPFVIVEIIGLPLDNRKSRTKAVDEDNGLNPVWSDEPVKFDVSCPELAFLRFEVQSEVNDSKTAIAVGTFPVTGLRHGYRSVPLQNRYSQPLDMSALLVHIDIKSPKDAEEESLFHVIEGVRRYRAELIASDTGRDARIRDELFKTEKKILDYLQGRRGSDQRYNGM